MMNKQRLLAVPLPAQLDLREADYDLWEADFYESDNESIYSFNEDIVEDSIDEGFVDDPLHGHEDPYLDVLNALETRDFSQISLDRITVQGNGFTIFNDSFVHALTRYLISMSDQLSSDHFLDLLHGRGLEQLCDIPGFIGVAREHIDSRDLTKSLIHLNSIYPLIFFCAVNQVRIRIETPSELCAFINSIITASERSLQYWPNLLAERRTVLMDSLNLLLRPSHHSYRHESGIVICQTNSLREQASELRKRYLGSTSTIRVRSFSSKVKAWLRRNRSSEVIKITDLDSGLDPEHRPYVEYIFDTFFPEE